MESINDKLEDATHDITSKIEKLISSNLQKLHPLISKLEKENENLRFRLKESGDQKK